MLIPRICSVCGRAHKLSYQRFLKCVKKVPNGEICYPDYFVSWKGNVVSVSPNEERWRQLCGLKSFRVRTFSLMQGWQYLCGLIKLEDVTSWFNGGTFIQLVDFDVLDRSETYQVFGFDSFLKVKKGSLQWVDRYGVGPFYDERSTVNVCCCETCLPEKKFDIVLDGLQAKVTVCFTCLFIDFGVGVLSSRIQCAQGHEDIRAVIRRSWRYFDKCRGYKIVAIPYFRDSFCQYVYKVKIQNKNFGDFYIFDDGACYFVEQES